MSSSNSIINEIAGRVIWLSSLYSTNKEFLERCEIKNHSLITDLKSGRIKTPGSSDLAQIVRGTGCNGTWLLTGIGKEFPPERDEINHAAEPGEAYISDFKQALHLIERIMQKPNALKENLMLEDLTLQSSRLTTSLLELRQGGRSGRGS